jgi:hypothetical protein
MNHKSRLAGLAAATLVAVAATMLTLGEWNGELLAATILPALPLYLVARDFMGRRRTPRPAWVPPWERTLDRSTPTVRGR